MDIFPVMDFKVAPIPPTGTQCYKDPLLHLAKPIETQDLLLTLAKQAVEGPLALRDHWWDRGLIILSHQELGIVTIV